jgi:hypothetical protein
VNGAAKIMVSSKSGWRWKAPAQADQRERRKSRIALFVRYRECLEIVDHPFASDAGYLPDAGEACALIAWSRSLVLPSCSNAVGDVRDGPSPLYRWWLPDEHVGAAEGERYRSGVEGVARSAVVLTGLATPGDGATTPSATSPRWCGLPPVADRYCGEAKCRGRRWNAPGRAVALYIARGLSAMKEKDADYFSFHNDGIISAPHLAGGCSFIRGRSGSSGLIVTVTGGHPPGPGQPLAGVSHAVAKATARKAGFMSCIELR